MTCSFYVERPVDAHAVIAMRRAVIEELREWVRQPQRRMVPEATNHNETIRLKRGRVYEKRTGANNARRRQYVAGLLACLQSSVTLRHKNAIFHTYE